MPKTKKNKLRKISEVKNLKGRLVLLRLTLNVPLKNNVIQNDFRLRRVIPTLEYLRKKRAKIVIVSHIGKDGALSLRPIVSYLNKHLEVGFLPADDKTRQLSVIESMRDGSVIVLENLRRLKGEMENSLKFSKELAKPFELFINEDFAASHRKHASIVGLPKLLPSFIGSLFAEEVHSLSRAFAPKHPFIIILGGAKFKTKLPLVKKFLPKADKIFIVGALANSFFKELEYEVGKSLVDDEFLGLAKLSRNKKIVLPKDLIVKTRNGVLTKPPIAVNRDEKIVDVGPETVAEIKEALKVAKFVMWNGPLGKFEDGFGESTEAVAHAIAKSDAYSIVGGGDSISAIEKLGILDKFNFVSTGGGAALDFLAKGTLPGIEAIKKSPKKKKV
ncbi:MAG TPA: phosphoglycerate kinase [Candidatus Paceibacterota bacterium]